MDERTDSRSLFLTGLTTDDLPRFSLCDLRLLRALRVEDFCPINVNSSVWFPMNDLLIESLQRFHHCFLDDGERVGGSQQTGWTGLVAKLLQPSGEG